MDNTTAEVGKAEPGVAEPGSIQEGGGVAAVVEQAFAGARSIFKLLAARWG